MKKSILTCALILTFFMVKSQNYNHAIGVKIGATSGISFKTMLSGNNALEIIAGGKYHGVHAMVLYEIHAQAFDVPGLYWYYGGGGHIGFWEGKYSRWYNDEKGSFTAIGVDGVFGMEYQIEDIPFTVSLDIVPTFNFIGYTGFDIDGGLGIRYVF